MRMGIVTVDGCFTSGIVALVDVLRTAEAVRADVDPRIPPLHVELVGPAQRVTGSTGLPLTTTRSLAELNGLDVVIVGALGTMNTADTVDAVRSRVGRAVRRALEELDHEHVALAAACSGTFPLAEAGLLDHGRATTSWWLGPVFRTRYPRVELDLDAMVVTDTRATTAGAAFAHVDLALTLLRRSSPALAAHVAPGGRPASVAGRLPGAGPPGAPRRGRARLRAPRPRASPGAPARG